MARSIKAELVLDTRKAEKGVANVGNALKALATGAAAKGIVDVANNFQEITNKLRSVSGSTDEAGKRFDAVVDIARKTRSDLSGTADLFFRLTKASEDLGLSQAETSRVTELFAKTLKNSGAGAQEAASAILQFSQAMASGKLSGDEFRSINETNSDLMDRLAKALGKPRGELKKLASEGKLTAKIVTNALLEQGDEIDATFALTTQTLAESFESIRTEFTILVGKIEEKTGIFSGLANTFKLVADNLDIVGAALAGVFAAQVAGSIMNVVKAVRAFRAANQAAAASAVLLQAVTGVGLLKVGAGLAAAGVTLGVMNAMFDEQADTVEDIVDNVDKQKGSTKEMADAEADLVEKKKEEKTLNDESLRILERQTEEFKSQLDELESNSAEFRDQLALQNDLLFASEDQRDVLNAIADIESDRKSALQDLADLTKIDAQERLTREKQINDEYDDRIKLTEEQLAVQQRIQNAQQSFLTNVDLVGQPFRELQKEVQLAEKLMNASSEAERRRIQKQFDLRKSLDDAAAALEIEKLAEINAAKEAAAEQGRTLTGSEEIAIAQKYAEEEMNIMNAQSAFETYKDAQLDGYEAMIQKSRQFGQGVKDAFLIFKDEVENNAALGTNLFNTMTQGWEDAFVKFAETGKLSFKDLFKTLMTEIIKMAANRLFLALFDPTGGLFSSLFAGFFANGGNIPSGKFGVVGESGPEIVTGPASVMSASDSARALGGGQTIVYNISAVDTQSFQSALARDPEFVYSLTRAGARRLPG